MSRRWIPVLLFWPLLLSGLSPWLLADRQSAPPPPTRIVVIDRDAIVLKLAEAQGAEAAIRTVNAMADRLAAQGFIVLDHRHVLRSPPSYLVTP